MPVKSGLYFLAKSSRGTISLARWSKEAAHIGFLLVSAFPFPVAALRLAALFSREISCECSMDRPLNEVVERAIVREGLPC